MCIRLKRIDRGWLRFVVSHVGEKSGYDNVLGAVYLYSDSNNCTSGVDRSGIDEVGGVEKSRMNRN